MDSDFSADCTFQKLHPEESVYFVILGLTTHGDNPTITNSGNAERIKVVMAHASRHDMSTQWWAIAGPTSQTVVQHSPNIGLTSDVCCDTKLNQPSMTMAWCKLGPLPDPLISGSLDNTSIWHSNASSQEPIWSTIKPRTGNYTFEAALRKTCHGRELNVKQISEDTLVKHRSAEPVWILSSY